MTRLRPTWSTLLLATALAACGGASEPTATPAAAVADPTLPLSFVPADSAYVFANFEPLPRAELDRWSALFDPIESGYRETMARARAHLAKEAKDGESAEKVQRLLSVLELFDDKMSWDGWERVGFTRDLRMAFYGVDLLPVLRVELGDPDRLRAFIAEIETRAGETLPVAQLDGLDYWRFAPDADKPFALVMAIIDRHLVVAFDAGADVVPLPVLLGLQRPARSMVDSGELAALNAAEGFGPHGTFLADARRAAGSLLGSEGSDTWFTRMAAAKGEAITPACRSEFAAIAATTPRLLGGYTAIEGGVIDSRTLLEMRGDLATAFAAITAPVPGLGRDDGSALMDIGFGIRLDKLAEFIQAQAAAINAAPYQCEALAKLNEGAREVGSQVAGLYMAAGWFTGLRTTLNGFDWPDGASQPTRIEGSLLVASPNPSALIGMLRGFVPQLADLNLVAGAAPQPLALGELGVPMAAQMPPTWAAMSDSALGLGFGEPGASLLSASLAQPPADPAPLLFASYSGRFYGDLNRRVEAMMKQVQSRAGDEDAERTDAAAMAHILEPMSSSVNELYAAFDRTSLWVMATTRGLEFRQVARLVDAIAD